MGILLLFSQFLFSQSYYINKDTHNYNPRGFQLDVDLPNGSIIYLDKDSEVSSYRPDEDTNIIKISGLYQGQKLTFYSSDVNILNNDTFDSELLEKKWIPSYYFSILKSKQIQQSLLDYEPFWKTLKERGVSTYALINKYGISGATINRMKKGGGISTMKIDDLCRILDCRVEDVIRYVSEK